MEKDYKLLFAYYPFEDILQGDGINLSDEFLFRIEIKEKEEGKGITLYGERKKSPIASDVGPYKEYSFLSGIKAIVGENGTGKTRFLKALMEDGYKIEEQYNPKTKAVSNRKAFIVAVIIKSVIHIRHSLPNGYSFDYVDNTDCKYKVEPPLQTRKNRRETANDFSPSTLIPNTTKIFLSNGSYNEWAVTRRSSFMKATYICLNPVALDKLRSSYYKNLFNLNENIYTDDMTHYWNTKAVKERKNYDFQKICNFRFYKSILGNEDYYHLLKFRNLHIKKYKSINDILSEEDIDYLNGKYDRNNSPFRSSNSYSDVRDVIVPGIRWNAWQCYVLEQKLKKDNSAEITLYINLLFEIACKKWKEIKADKIKDKKGLVAKIRRELKKIDNTNYFIEALKEIKAYEGVGGREYKYSENYEGFCKCLDLIDNSYSRQEPGGRVNSFVLRYIVMDEPGLASGESAKINFYSWISLLQDFSKISGDNYENVQRNVLLMIDEIDLYLHPEWQRIFLKQFLDDISLILPDRTIQLIITTHSPIMLSDFTSDSIVYLRKTKEGSEILQPTDELQTFGKDIHTLLNDSFYLKGTMGVIAENFINEQISLAWKLLKNKNKRSDKEVSILEQRTKLIGNDVIRQRLEVMLEWIKEGYVLNDSNDI